MVSSSSSGTAFEGSNTGVQIKARQAKSEIIMLWIQYPNHTKYKNQANSHCEKWKVNS